MNRFAVLIAGMTLAALPLCAQENLIPNAKFTQLAKNGLPAQWSGQCWGKSKGTFSFEPNEKALRMIKTDSEGLTLLLTDFDVPGQGPCEIKFSFEIMVPSTTAGTVVCKRDAAGGKTVFYQEFFKFGAMSDWKTVTATVKCPSAGKVNLSFRLMQPGEILLRNVTAELQR
jgi:hypothetical protein